MVWRSSPKGKDKLFACLTYLLPLIEVLPFGGLLFNLFPPLAIILIPLLPLFNIYYFSVAGFPIVAIAIFIWLYAGVIQNVRLPHFLRYNALQALLLSIFAVLCQLFLQLLGIAQQLTLSSVLSGTPDATGASGFIVNALLSVIFLFVVGSSFYSIFQCIRGLYAEIPVISDAAYSQLR
jgi:hypothetical protein